MNSPAAVCDLYSYATSSMSKPEDKAKAAAVRHAESIIRVFSS
jgi:hypothetical protein